MNFWFGLSWVILISVMALFAADITGVIPLTEGDGPGLLLVPLSMAIMLGVGGYMARKSASRVWIGQIMIVVFGISLSATSWTYRSTLTPEAIATSVHAILARVTTKAEADRLMPKQPEAAGEGQFVVRRGKGGQFWLQAKVNGKFVRFLVDTGASFIALSRNDAQRIGFKLSELDFNSTARTPNGSVAIATVRLSEVRIGDLSVKNLRAAVLKSSTHNSLLGMNFLKHLKQFEIRGDKLYMSQ